MYLYSVTYWYQYEFVNIYFILCVVIQYYFILLFTYFCFCSSSLFSIFHSDLLKNKHLVTSLLCLKPSTLFPLLLEWSPKIHNTICMVLKDLVLVFVPSFMSCHSLPLPALVTISPFLFLRSPSHVMSARKVVPFPIYIHLQVLNISSSEKRFLTTAFPFSMFS